MSIAQTVKMASDELDRIYHKSLMFNKIRSIQVNISALRIWEFLDNFTNEELVENLYK